MITMNAASDRRFYRDRDRAVLGGVCAGLAEYLGFNLKVTRLLAFVAFLMAMPVAVIAYFAAVFLIPSASGLNDEVHESKYAKRRERRSCKRNRKARRREKAMNEERAMDEKERKTRFIDERCDSMDRRLATLEKHVTSRRFQLDQEFSRL